MNGCGTLSGGSDYVTAQRRIRLVNGYTSVCCDGAIVAEVRFRQRLEVDLYCGGCLAPMPAISAFTRPMGLSPDWVWESRSGGEEKAPASEEPASVAEDERRRERVAALVWESCPCQPCSSRRASFARNLGMMRARAYLVPQLFADLWMRWFNVGRFTTELAVRL